jgi:hypothetical protein
MPATALTIECRAIANRMRAFPNCEGNAQYLRKLIYEDSAKVATLIPLIDASSATADEKRGVYEAASICGSVGECSGNTNMWPLVTDHATQLDRALDILDAAVVEDPAARRQ